MSAPIVVRAPNWVGDQILALPFFDLLRKKYPRETIVAACPPWVADLHFRDLVDDVFVIELNRKSGLLERLRTNHDAARFFRKRYGRAQLGISLPNSWSTAWFLKSAGAAVRRGYGAEGRGVLLTDKRSWKVANKKHRAQAYCDLAFEVGATVPDVFGFWNGRDLFSAERSWPSTVQERLPSSVQSGSYVVVAPGATADSRRWPLERFAGLMNQIHEAWKTTFVVVGGPAEQPLAGKLQSMVSATVIDKTGGGPVGRLAELFKHAKLTIGNESGLAHVASLCGPAVQIVCGAADPRRTQPLGPGKVQVRFNPVSCWPCEKNVCFQSGDRHLDCLRGITSNDVWSDLSRNNGGTEEDRFSSSTRGT